jgi:Ser/Thr protein kinase RdoA (MazF antagonist)
MHDLRQVAREALRRYDLAPRRVTRAAESFNTVFRVTTDSAGYALRVGAASAIHAAGTLEAEGAWLRRLRDDGVTVPALHANTAGQFGTPVAAGPSGTRVCALFDWIAGRSLRTRLTAPAAAALGRLAARLHESARDWTPADPPDVLVADRVLYWRLPTRLTAPDLPFRTLFADALDRAQAAVDALWRTPPHRPHLLHGDLTPANAVAAPGGTIVPIDFQDVVRGFDVQDLAISVAALRRAPAGPRLTEAFREGYAAVRPWPDVSPAVFESLIAARALHQINLTLNLREPADLSGYLAGRAERLLDWLRKAGDGGPA